MWRVVGASAALTVLTAVASQFVAPLPGAPPGARMFPRVPESPTSASELLRLLGVGSVIWYMCFVSAPLFVWVSRRFPYDQRRRVTSLGMQLLLVVLCALVTTRLQYSVSYRGAGFVPAIDEYMRFG